MIFHFFRSKEEKEEIANIQNTLSSSLEKDGVIDVKEVNKKIKKLSFEISHSEKKKIFMTPFDGDGSYTINSDGIHSLSELAKVLEIDNDTETNTIINNLTEELRVAQKVEDIKHSKKLPTIDIDIILKNKEEAYFLTDVIFSEERSRRVYEGGSRGASVRVAKGLSFRVGATKGDAVSEDYLKEIDSGEFIITNKRILFVGANKTWNIKIEKLIRFEDLDIDDTPSLSFTTETASKKKFVSFDDEEDASIVKAILNKIAKGTDEEIEEVEEDVDDGDIFLNNADNMEDETLN